MVETGIPYYKRKIEEYLSNAIPADSPYYSSLVAGGRYTILAPAKRIRPLLTVCVAEMLCQGSLRSALPPACALELVHTYSLIHDDLPCMDNDDFRRGLPTLHRVYTEGHAVLIGDYLLTYAFEMIAAAPLLSASQKIELILTLSRAAGSEGMIGGQVMDIEQSPHINQMHNQKTAALFCAAVTFGIIIAGVSLEIKTLLQQFGIQFGKLFQMVDDLLDGDHPLGHEQAHSAVASLFQDTCALLKKIPGDSSFLKSLTELVYTQTQITQIV